MKILRTYILIATLISTTACNGWLTIQPNEVMSEDEMFETTGGFYDALHGVYATLKDNYGHSGGLMTTTIEHMAAQWEVKGSTTEEKLRNHDYIAAGEQVFASIFSNQFEHIANINNILKYLEIQTCLRPSDYDIIKGECLGLRAWLHFDMLRIWGPIPGFNNTVKKYLPYAQDFSTSRHTYYIYTDFVKLLQKDLTEAENLLAPFEPERNFRLNYIGVLALQSRLNLWLQDKEKALEYAEKLIGIIEEKYNTLYMFAKLDNIGFKDYRFAKEHLFGIYINFESVPFPNTTTLYNNTSFLDELYEYSTSDIRTKLWKDRTLTDLSEPAKDLLKYLSGNGSMSIIKLPEIYFIAMECASINRANELYRTICQSRGLPEVTIESETQINDILYKEYRKEFFGEGVLFYYFKRKNSLYIPRNPNKCTEKSYVLDLPQREVDVNS